MSGGRRGGICLPVRAEGTVKSFDEFGLAVLALPGLPLRPQGAGIRCRPSPSGASELADDVPWPTSTTGSSATWAFHERMHCAKVAKSSGDSDAARWCGGLIPTMLLLTPDGQEAVGVLQLLKPTPLIVAVERSSVPGPLYAPA
jgi:hypothetical protein